MNRSGHLRGGLLLMAWAMGGCTDPAPEAQPLGAEGAVALEDAAFVLDVIKSDYAGWPTKSEGPLAMDIAEAEQAMMEAAKAAETPSDHLFALYDYVDAFKDGHLGLSFDIVVTPRPQPTDRDMGDGAQTTPRPVPSPNLFLRSLDDGTVWLRVPHFGLSILEPLSELLAQKQDVLTSADRLILDLRSNGGGNDAAFEPLLPYLVDGDIEVTGVAFRVSERNLSVMERQAVTVRETNPQVADTIEKIMQGIVARADGQRDIFVPLYEDSSDIMEITPRPGPRRVGILVDGAASSAEQLILDVKDQSRVTTFGYDNTAGVLDFSNVVGEPLPSGRATLRWATTRSLRLPEDPVDDVGIAPDVRFAETVTDPVAEAAAHLKAQE